jgi:transposase
MSRGDLTEEGWRVIAPLLPEERGRWGRPAQDNRRYVNGMLWVLRTGAPWRDLPEKYGNWNSVYRRHLRWRDLGVWEAVLAVLADCLMDDTAYSMDSTVIRAHVHAAGASKKNAAAGNSPRRLVVRGEASPVKFTASVMHKEGRSSSGSRAVKQRTAKPTKP